MNDARSQRIQDDQEKLARAAEEHDWMEEITDGAIGGLVSPLTHEPPIDGIPEEPAKAREDAEREKREKEERLNEVW